MTIDEVMEQAQVFASSYSLVGGRFDDGSQTEDSNEAKANLRSMLAALLAPQPALAVKGLLWDECDRSDIYHVKPTYGGGPKAYMLARASRIFSTLFDTVDEAKAFAQVDHETRIRSQIVASPATVLHQFASNGPGVIGADNCQICGRWTDKPETDVCKDRLPAPPPSGEVEAEIDETWRKLALQFDGHRIQAMCLLRAVAAGEAGTADVEAFLSAPPLSGEQVLADRIAALSVTPATADGWRLVPEDLVTHLGDFLAACKEAKSAAEDKSPAGHDTDDAKYWQHQIDVIHRVQAAFPSAPTATATGGR